jgi:hypothetical protein
MQYKNKKKAVPKIDETRHAIKKNIPVDVTFIKNCRSFSDWMHKFSYTPGG